MEAIILPVIEGNFATWLLDQAGLVVVMGVVIYVLYKRYDKVEAEKSELAKEVIKLMVGVENKMDIDKNDNVEIKHRLDKIIEIVTKWEKN